MGHGISKPNSRLNGLLFLGFCFSIGTISWAQPMSPPIGDHRYGEILVKLRQQRDLGPGLTYDYVNVYSRLLSALTRSLGESSVLSIRASVMDREIQVLRLSRDEDLPLAMERLKQDPAVEIAEPNYIFSALNGGTPNDPDFEKDWGLQNLGQKDDEGTVGRAGSDIHVLPLWKEGIRGSRKIVVGVIDTGIDWEHPDLKENLYTNPGEIDGDGIDNDGNGLIDDIHGWNFGDNNNKSQDDQGHGSHCAGTIGGVGNNGIGVAGVNWEVSLMPIKFLNAEGHGSLQAAIDAIRYGIKMKLPILSNSWGNRSGGEALQSAIEEAKQAGIVFIAAAGNNHSDNSKNPTYPASFPVDNIISVAATNNQDRLGSFSNYGATTVHVAAPGVKIFSTYKNGGYKFSSGTSMATPHVAGIAALLMSVEPELNYTEIKNRLMQTSDPVPGLRRRVIAGGRVNAYNAVHKVIPIVSKPNPEAWISESVNIESAHPYESKTNRVFEISHPGAEFLRIHFRDFDVESNIDHVYLETPDGEVLDDLTGKLGEFTTDYISSDRVYLRLTSDRTTNLFGFVVDRIDYIQKNGL